MSKHQRCNLKLRTVMVYLSLAWTIHCTKSEVSTQSRWWRLLKVTLKTLALTTGYREATLHISPSLKSTWISRTHMIWKGWCVCLGKDVLNVKFAYAVTPFSVVQYGYASTHAIASVLWGSQISVLLSQLIANRTSDTLWCIASCRQPEHPMQLHKHRSL